MPLPLSNFPLEIQVHILKLCSHSDLGALSRVHTSLRDVADYVLYHHIHFCKRPTDMAIFRPFSCDHPLGLKEDGSLLHTLVANSLKASIVKTFYFELEHEQNLDWTDVLPFIMAKLREALEKMHNLTDFRVVYRPWENSLSSPVGVSQVIRFVIHHSDHGTELQMVGSQLHTQEWPLQAPQALYSLL